MNDFEKLWLDGPGAIEEAIANAWVNGTEQERERIIGSLNSSGILQEVTAKQMNKIIDIVLKLS